MEGGDIVKADKARFVTASDARTSFLNEARVSGSVGFTRALLALGVWGVSRKSPAIVNIMRTVCKTSTEPRRVNWNAHV